MPNMSTILWITTHVLNAAGILFSLVYLFLNTFGRRGDIVTRNTHILAITRASMLLSLLFALVACLISPTASLSAGIARAATQYAVIAISWLCIIAICGFMMLIRFVSKTTFTADYPKKIRDIFRISLWGALLGAIISFLLG